MSAWRIQTACSKSPSIFSSAYPAISPFFHIRILTAIVYLDRVRIDEFWTYGDEFSGERLGHGDYGCGAMLLLTLDSSATRTTERAREHTIAAENARSCEIRASGPCSEQRRATIHFEMIGRQRGSGRRTRKGQSEMGGEGKGGPGRRSSGLATRSLRHMTCAWPLGGEVDVCARGARLSMSVWPWRNESSEANARIGG